MKNEKIQIIEASTILGLRPTGVEIMPKRVMDDGLQKLAEKNQVIKIKNMNYLYTTLRDKSGIINSETIIEFSKLLKKELKKTLGKGLFPLIIGGDCSILLGIMPALKEIAESGLITFDAHSDYYMGFESETGEAADMDIAIITGKGPEYLTNIDNMKPYVREEHVIHIGQRDEEEVKEYNASKIEDSMINMYTLKSILKMGIEKTAESVIEKMNHTDAGEFWIHFDTDVINDAENPAVDYRLAGGLSFQECERILKKLMETGKISGISISIYNPLLDNDHAVSGKLVKLIKNILDIQ